MFTAAVIHQNFGNIGVIAEQVNGCLVADQYIDACLGKAFTQPSDRWGQMEQVAHGARFDDEDVLCFLIHDPLFNNFLGNSCAKENLSA